MALAAGGIGYAVAAQPRMEAALHALEKAQSELDAALLIERGVIDELVFESVYTAKITL